MKIYLLTKTLNSLLDVNLLTIKKEKADIIVVGGKQIVYEEFPNLKYIFKVGVGSDNIDFNECKKRKIEVIFPSDKTKNIIYEEVSNFTIYTMLNHFYKNVGNVDTWGKVQRDSIINKEILIIGSKGNIGSRVLEKTKVYNNNVYEFDSICNTMNELYKRMEIADIISLHIPLNNNTKDLINNHVLKNHIKNDAVIINTSRAGIVNENDLYENLKISNVKAYFDVLWEEPYNGKLKELPNFYMTPHVASSSRSFIEGLHNDLMRIVKEG